MSGAEGDGRISLEGEGEGGGENGVLSKESSRQEQKH